MAMEHPPFQDRFLNENGGFANGYSGMFWILLPALGEGTLVLILLIAAGCIPIP